MCNSVIRTCLDLAVSPATLMIGMGNMDRSDDGAGLKIAEKLKARFPERAFLESEKSVEGLVFDFIENPAFDTILFIDAVNFGEEPGTVRLFTAEDIPKFQPAVSTHKVPMSLLMDLIVQKNKKPLLLGIQPGSVKLMGEMSEAVKKVIVQF